MFTNKDKLYLQTSDIPNLKNKINRAIELSKELERALRDLDNYDIEFKIQEKKETPVAGTTDVNIVTDGYVSSQKNPLKIQQSGQQKFQ